MDLMPLVHSDREIKVHHPELAKELPTMSVFIRPPVQPQTHLTRSIRKGRIPLVGTHHSGYDTCNPNTNSDT